MKTAISLVMVSTLLSWSSVGFAAAPKEGFFIGGAGNLLLINGTGEISLYGESIDFDLSSDLRDVDELGFNWSSKVLFGIKPLVGYRFNPNFATIASYNFYWKKSSDDSERFYEDFEWWTYEEKYEWSQSSIELLALIYPQANSGFFLMAGLEFISINIDVSATLTDPYGDRYYESDDDDASATGIVLGVGYEFPHSGKLNYYFAGQYSFAKVDDKLFASNSDWEVDVGGFGVQFGLRYCVGGKESR